MCKSRRNPRLIPGCLFVSSLYFDPQKNRTGKLNTRRRRPLGLHVLPIVPETCFGVVEIHVLKTKKRLPCVCRCLFGGIFMGGGVGGTLGQDASRRSETPSAAGCSLCSSHPVLERRKCFGALKEPETPNLPPPPPPLPSCSSSAWLSNSLLLSSWNSLFRSPAARICLCSAASAQKPCWVQSSFIKGAGRKAKPKGSCSL